MDNTPEPVGGLPTSEPNTTQPLKPSPPLAAPKRRDPGRSQVRAQKLIAFGIPALFAVLGAAGIVLWTRSQPQIKDIAPRVPTIEAQHQAGAAPGQPAAGVPGVAGGLTATAAGPGGGAAVAPGAGNVAMIPGSWPRFRGPNGDNISPEGTALATSWGAQGPRRLWSIALGEGHAGAAVLNGRVYVLDYDQAARMDKLRCFAFADGREQWSQSYPVEVKRNHGMSRTVPAVTSQYVVTLGPKGHVMCCDATSGKVVWKIDLVAQWGTTIPTWYAGQCPLIDGDKVILAPAGKALLIAVQLSSGKVIWQSPNPRNWTMTHSSIVPMSFGGKRMYVYCGSGGVAGISADNGQILWDTTEWVVSTATVPSPLPMGDGRIFLCGGYNSGAMMIQLSGSGGQFSAKKLYRLQPTVFGSDQQTPILYNGYIYGVIPGGQLVCLDPGGKQMWASGTKRFGLGPYVIAGGMLYVLSDTGELSLVSATPSGFKLLASAKILSGSDAWAPIAIAGGRLIARDVTTMVCLDIAR